MKKVFIAVAVTATILLGFSSCKNASMQCWEYTIIYEGESERGYAWCTQDDMEYRAYSYKKEGVTGSYEKASKYKTADDCIAADYALDNN